MILGLFKDGKAKKAAYLVEELDKKKLVPNVTTFSAFIIRQVIRKNSKWAFQLYRTMRGSGCHPNEHTFQMLISALCDNEDFDGAVQVLRDMFERCITLDSNIISKPCYGLSRCGKIIWH